jgi:tRNA nucleotidyltransferase/poly(A) polymerase
MARASNPILARQAATDIVRQLRDAGHIAYFAGGCVRDALLGLSPTDYDVATDATPPAVRALFRSTDEVGAAFGVVLVHQRVEFPTGGRERVSVEVATFRSDGPYTDARRPDTVRFSDPQSDAARRDFTINALFLDPLAPPDADTPPSAGGRIIDYVSGLADLRARILRAVGDPAKRLAEDHLRALRAVRFAARLDLRIEPATAEAIRRDAAELRGVSRERIGEELRRMLAHPTRARALSLLQQLTLDGPVLAEPPRDSPLPTIDHLPPSVSPMLTLAAWCLDRAAAAHAGLGEQAAIDLKRRLAAALCLSNDESSELAETLVGHQLLVRAWTAAGTARRKRWASTDWFAGALDLARPAHPALIDSILAETNKLQMDGIGLAPPPLVTGDHLAAAGMKPGPVFRRILDEVYDAQLEGRVSTPAQAMELAARLYV